MLPNLLVTCWQHVCINCWKRNIGCFVKRFYIYIFIFYDLLFIFYLVCIKNSHRTHRIHLSKESTLSLFHDFSKPVFAASLGILSIFGSWQWVGYVVLRPFKLATFAQLATQLIQFRIPSCLMVIQVFVAKITAFKIPKLQFSLQ